MARFPAFAYPDFTRLWAGQIISAAGSQMQMAALNWQIVEVTSESFRPVALGLVGLFRVVPIICFSLLGGAMADSRDRRGLMLVTQSVLTLVALSLGFLSLTHQINLWWLYALTAVGAGATAFDSPARQSIVPSLVPREHLPNAFAINSTGMQVASISGPVLSGIVLYKYGFAAAYFANAVSFLAVIVALLLMSPKPPMESPREEGEAERKPLSPFSPEALMEGIRFVLGNRILVATMAIDFFATFFSSASALMPLFAKDILHLDARGYGILLACPAAGSLIAGVLMSFLPPIKAHGKTLIVSVALYGVATILFGVSKVMWISALCLAATGATDTVSTVIRQTVRQLTTPDRLRGRMVSINMLFFMGGPQLGELEAGLVAKWAGAPFSVVSGGVACLVAVAVLVWRMPWLAKYRLDTSQEVR